MKFLTSGLSFVIQAILVVAGVLVFAYFDPFDIFVSTKLKLKDTPAHIREIRSIGELITAEYYGEVISSYQSIIYIQKKEAIILTTNRLQIMDTLFIERLKELSAIRDDKDREKQFDSTLEEFNKRDNFADYFKAVKQEIKRKFLRSLMNDLLDVENIRKLEDNKAYLKDLQSEKQEEIVEIYSKRAVRKPQMILIGRGKVQAGFRFDKLDDRNMMVDTLRNRIVLFGIHPEILSCDINPWLIPELGIKGFEILELNGRADDPSILYKVKKACLDSLLQNALASDILNIAKTNAEQNLQSFFSLILNDPAVEVRIESDLLSYYLKILNRDSVINSSQFKDIFGIIMSYLDPAIHQSKSGNDSLRAFALLDKLKLCRIAIGKDTFHVNPFTYPIYNLLMYNRINSKNKDSIRSVLTTNKYKIQKDWNSYSRWFYQPVEKKISIRPDTLTYFVLQSDTFFNVTFNRIYPDTLKSKNLH